MLIFYLTVTRNPAGVNQSIKAGLLTHLFLTTPSQVCEPSGFKLQFCSDRQSQDLQQQVLLPVCTAFPFHSLTVCNLFSETLTLQRYKVLFISCLFYQKNFCLF